MRRLSAPMILCLLLLSTACATTRPVIISEPLIIEPVTLACPVIPVHLLQPCAVLSLPAYGITWADTIEIIKTKDLQQHSCNERLTIIGQWESDNIRDEISQ